MLYLTVIASPFHIYICVYNYVSSSATELVVICKASGLQHNGVHILQIRMHIMKRHKGMGRTNDVS